MRPMVALAALGLLVGGCTYDPPPDVVKFLCADNNCLIGEAIVLQFSEPVEEGSVSIDIWPGEEDGYDIERNRLPSVEPIVDDCTIASSPCDGKDGQITLSLIEDRTALSIEVGAGALGPLNRPLVLELSGTLADDAGRTLDVTRSYDFQMVPSVLPPVDVASGSDADVVGDAAPPEPLGVEEGPFLFYAELATPLGFDLQQQYFADVAVDQESGAFYIVLTDGDPVSGAPLNTQDPEEVNLDLGIEGFVFLVHGTIRRQDASLVFESEPFTLQLKIGPITFALRDSVMRGTIGAGEGTGRARWDGTLAVSELFIDTGNGNPQTYPAQQDNFQLNQMTADQIPDGMPLVCDAAPCAELEGPQCEVPTDGWPPAAVCPDDDAPAAP